MKISKMIKKLSKYLEEQGDGEVWIIPFSSTEMQKEFGLFTKKDYLLTEDDEMVTPLSVFPYASENDLFIDELF